MKIKMIDFGYVKAPQRQHYNDAGADVYATKSHLLLPHTTTKIGLGFGLKIPDGYMASVYPRSGLSSQGIVCELPPIDPGYRGEIHAIVSNLSNNSYQVAPGERIGQLVVTPVIIAEFVRDDEEVEERGTGAFASTGK